MSFYLLREKTRYRFRSYDGMEEPALLPSEAPDRASDAAENRFHKRCRQSKRRASARAVCNWAARTMGDRCFPKQL